MPDIAHIYQIDEINSLQKNLHCHWWKIKVDDDNFRDEWGKKKCALRWMVRGFVLCEQQQRISCELLKLKLIHVTLIAALHFCIGKSQKWHLISLLCLNWGWGLMVWSLSWWFTFQHSDCEWKWKRENVNIFFCKNDNDYITPIIKMPC